PLESLCRHSNLPDAIEKSRSREDGDWSCVPLHKSDRLVSTGCCRKKRCPLLCCFAASCSQAPRLMCSSSFSAAKVCDRNQWRMPFSAYVKAGLLVVAAAAALFAAAGTVAIPGFWAKSPWSSRFVVGRCTV